MAHAINSSRPERSAAGHQYSRVGRRPGGPGLQYRSDRRNLQHDATATTTGSDEHTNSNQHSRATNAGANQHPSPDQDSSADQYPGTANSGAGQHGNASKHTCATSTGAHLNAGARDHAQLYTQRERVAESGCSWLAYNHQDLDHQQ